MNASPKTYQLVTGVYFYRSPGGGVLSFSRESGNQPAYHKMNGQAAVMLDALLAGHSVEKIARRLSQQHDISLNVATHDVRIWLESLLTERLVELTG